MLNLRLQTKVLCSLLLVSVGLTCATLLVVQQVVQRQAQGEIFADLRNSVLTFQNVQRQREENLSRMAALLADLPTLKALMTTQDSATIQDASGDYWKLAGSSLFVLADRAGKVVALHTATPGFSQALAQQSLGQPADSTQWWSGGGHLYQVFLRPIYFGSPADNRLLGMVAVGYEIDDNVARQVADAAGSQVAFRYGNSVVVSTLSREQQAELLARVPGAPPHSGPEDFRFGGERFLSASIDLSPAGDVPAVWLSVFKSFDRATVFLHRLNRILLALGLVAAAVGAGLVSLITPTFARPLKTLIAGVRSMETGDFNYPLEHSDDEVGEVVGAFDRMRRSLRTTQQKLLESERLATIGVLASSISHDLRHSLTGIVANAEFLCESDLNRTQREDLYQDIRFAADQMSELIESLVELSRTRAPLNWKYGDVSEVVQRAISAVRVHPGWQRVQLTLSSEGQTEAWFDEKKLQRVFYNLVLNACEAVQPDNGRVEVAVRRGAEQVHIWVRDNGNGIPQGIRETLFQPFISSGKHNGTGLGLAVVQKIVHDHGGEITVESTSADGTVFTLALPAAGERPRDKEQSADFMRDARAG